jgi:hypothetical protein
MSWSHFLKILEPRKFPSTSFLFIASVGCPEIVMLPSVRCVSFSLDREERDRAVPSKTVVENYHLMNSDRFSEASFGNKTQRNSKGEKANALVLDGVIKYIEQSLISPSLRHGGDQDLVLVLSECPLARDYFQKADKKL